MQLGPIFVWKPAIFARKLTIAVNNSWFRLKNASAPRDTLFHPPSKSTPALNSSKQPTFLEAVIGHTSILNNGNRLPIPLTNQTISLTDYR